MRVLSAAEMIEHHIFNRELITGTVLSAEEEDAIKTAVKDSLVTLKTVGISASDDRVALIGTPLTAGYWKSYVEVEKKERWRWIDQDLATAKSDRTTNSLARALKITAVVSVERVEEGESIAAEALELLRTGRPATNVSSGSALHLLEATLSGRDLGAEQAIDFVLSVTVGDRIFRQRFTAVLLGEPELLSRMIAWQENMAAVLAKNGVQVSVGPFKTWRLPTDEESHRIARLARVNAPAAFRASHYERAASAFQRGDLNETIAIFRALEADRPEQVLNNNLAFCLLLQGAAGEALKEANKAVTSGFKPLHELNLALALWLNGQQEEGAQRLIGVLGRFRQLRRFEEEGLVAVHVLTEDLDAVHADSDLPVGAALVINLLRMKRMTRHSALATLRDLYGPDAEQWLARY